MDTVTSIGEYAFAKSLYLTTVNMPDNITSIGKGAFYYCENLTSVYLSESLESIADLLFSSCTSLSSIELPDSITRIGWNAFYSCSELSSVNIPNGVTYIEQDAFSCCYSLFSLNIPESVTAIGSGAFNYCTGGTGIFTIYFRGDCPILGEDIFAHDAVTAYYPADNETWTKDVMLDYAGTVAWMPYGSETGDEENNDDDSGSDSIWIFGEDDFCFTNNAVFWYSRNILGNLQYDSYYIAENMFSAFLRTLTNEEIAILAKSYASSSAEEEMEEVLGTASETLKINQFLNNNLITWAGSCYGMSLTASLLKAGYLLPEELDSEADMTHDLKMVTVSSADNNEELESILNLYQITQKLAMVESRQIGDVDFAEFMGSIWELACNVTDSEQLFLIYLRNNEQKTGHTVVCYGAEECEYSSEDQQYDKRLLLYNPNSNQEDYLYISNDFQSAFVLYEAENATYYDEFGYYMSQNGSLNISSLDISHSIYLSPTETTDTTEDEGYYSLEVDNSESDTYTITDSNGAYVTVSDGVITGGSLEANIVWPAGMVYGDSEMNTLTVYTLYLPDTSDYYVLAPVNGGTVDALLTYNGFSVNLAGKLESVKVCADGTVDVENSEGVLTLDIILNNSGFDYVTVSGEANGDVHLSITQEDITITGDLTNYVVANMDNDCHISAVNVDGDINVQAVMEGKAVALYTDENGDGTFETPLSHTHDYIYTDNGDTTHTATCIEGDDTYTESHIYENGVCNLCGAMEPSPAASSGTCGEKLNWSIDVESGILAISGTGDMKNYESDSQPWSSYSEIITSVVIEDGATSIGDYAFYGFTATESVTIPESVTVIGNHAFDLDDNLAYVFYAGSKISWNRIAIGTDNDVLAAAVILYGSIEDDTSEGGEEAGEGSDTSKGVDTGSSTGSGPDQNNGTGSDTTTGTSGTDSSTETTASDTNATENSDVIEVAEASGSETDTVSTVASVESADTGDKSLPLLPFVLLIFSSAVLLTIGMMQRKRSNRI